MTLHPARETRASLPPVVAGTGARIDESACIGCLKCVRACPVDAIVGAAGFLHAVVPEWCIGCGLCLPPCPVDCIELVPSHSGPGQAEARERYLAKLERGPGRGTRDPGPASRSPKLAEKQDYIREAVARARARRGKRTPGPGTRGPRN